MAKIDNIFKKEIKKSDPRPKRLTTWIHYSKLKPNKRHYRGGETPEEKQKVREAEESLADLIEADGEVLQNLLVRKIDTDEYEIIAGHHRRGACRILVENRGKEQFALLPCSVLNLSEARAEFSQYSSNGFAPKTDYEIMCELERMKYLLENYPEEFPDLQSGRMVERLAKQMNMKKTTVGEYQTISRNLGSKSMEMFKSGELKKSAAVQLASLPEEEQESLIDAGITTHRQIAEYKEMKKAETEGRADCDLSKNTGREPMSPEAMEKKTSTGFPVMKNNEQRKAWLQDYQNWGIWYEDTHIGVKYYKYDFANGARLIAEEYQRRSGYDKSDYVQVYLHLVGGPTPPKDKAYGIPRWQRHEYYCRHANNVTELVEFLKFVQKEGD